MKWKKISYFTEMFFIYNFFTWEIRKKWHHRVRLVKPVGNMLFDLEKSIWKFGLKSDQVKVSSTSVHDPSGSICRSSEAVRRAKSFGTICVSLSPFYCELLTKNGLRSHLNSFDLRWPPCEPWTSVAPGSAQQMGWVAMILKELGGLDRFIRSGKHFHISP